MGPRMQKVDWSGVQALSQETETKGDAFIEALIKEGHTYSSMKGAFVKCALRRMLRETKGVVAKTAARMETSRNWIFGALNKLRMREELETIRATESGEQK